MAKDGNTVNNAVKMFRFNKKIWISQKRKYKQSNFKV